MKLGFFFYFKSLSHLHLSNTKISYKGINNLVKSLLIENLWVLTLSNNTKMSEIGAKYISFEH